MLDSEELLFIPVVLFLLLLATFLTYLFFGVLDHSILYFEGIG